MTQFHINKIGLVSHNTTKGIWALNLARHLARAHSLHLTIFDFVVSPFSDVQGKERSKGTDKRDPAEIDQQLRRQCSGHLAGYKNVEFHVCPGQRYDFELWHCLKEKYQILLIPYLERGMYFGSISIEEFAYRFISPIILVGPDNPKEFHINEPADAIIDIFKMPVKQWNKLPKPKNIHQAVVNQ